MWDSATLWRVSALQRIRHSDSNVSLQSYVMQEKVGVICVMPRRFTPHTLLGR